MRVYNYDKSTFHLPRQDVLRRFILSQNLAGQGQNFVGVKEKNYCFTTNQERGKCGLWFDVFTLTYKAFRVINRMN